MADPISVLGLAITVGAAGAQLSLTLFDIANTIKYATEEISEVAADLSTLSSILTQLSDVLNEQQSLCKPQLFKSMQSILERFKDIEDQLKKITGGPKTLKHVKWFFRKPKTKVLLKKVESVKAALTLVLNIIQLAKEEKTKSSSSGNGFVFKNQTTRGNRFRKIVESVVQTNRLAIENAQKEDEDNPTEKRRELDVSIARWRKPPNDTATWLYHLVFTSGPLPTQPLQRDGDTVVTVEDSHEARSVRDSWACDSSSEYEDAVQVVKRGSNQSPEEPLLASHLTYWAQPSRIVDRLLRSWTNLDSAQIEASAIEYVSAQDEASARAINEKIDDYKKDEEKRKGKAGVDSPFSSEDSDDELWTDYRPGTSKNSRAASASSSRRKLDGPRHNTPHGHSTPPRKSTLRTRFDPNLVSQPDHPIYTPYASSMPYGQPYPGYTETLPMPAVPSTNPFVPPFLSQPIPAFGNAPVSPPAQIPLPPPPAPPRPPDQSTQPPDAGRLSRILELLIVEQEAREKELEQKARAEGSEESKDNEYDHRLDALHNLILQQREEQIAREKAVEAQKATEKAEEQRRRDEETNEKRAAQEMAEKMAEAVKRVRGEVEAEAAEKAREAKRLADREIAEANAAVKAAKKAKKFAETQAANRARNEAETKAREERMRLDEDYKKLIEDYKKQLEVGEKTSALQLQLQQDDRNLRDQSSLPLRKTCIADGERRIEITEFTKEQLDPFIPAHLAPIRFYQENFAPLGSFASTSRNLKRNGARKTRSSYRDSESTISLQSDDESKSSQKVIILPTRTDRDSIVISEVETNLEECGFTASFEMDNRNDRMLIRSLSEGDDPIWGTLFWEPPLLNPQSELLESLKSKGWKPLYLRMSEAGQTYFLGNQPVHVNFFKPQYRPQLEPSQNSPSPNASQNEHLIIGRDLVDEYVLEEFGFEFKTTNSGGYALDFRLTANDVDTLINRSFMMRETGFRRQYRQLGPAVDPKRMVDKYEPSLTSESTVASVQTEGWSDWEDNCKQKTFQTPNEVSSSEELQQPVDEHFDAEASQSPGAWTADSPIKSPLMPTPEAPHSHLRPRSVRSDSSKLHAD